jgi:hypothetical protein
MKKPDRGYWFWIDDSDQASKSAFALMLQLSRLDLARQRLGADVDLAGGALKASVDHFVLSFGSSKRTSTICSVRSLP